MKTLFLFAGGITLLAIGIFAFNNNINTEKQPENVQHAYFVSGNYSLVLNSESEGWVRNGWTFTIAPRSGVIDFTGWEIRSTVTGKTYKFGKVLPLGGTSAVNIVLDANQEGALFVQTAEAKEDYLAEGNEYHVHLGNDTTWNRESDTIELLRPDGSVADTYSY